PGEERPPAGAASPADHGGPMSQLVFDDRLAAQLETLYRTRDVLRRRRLVREALAAAPGERVLGVGCGPGVVVAELLEQVGPTGSVTGVDASPQTLALARRRTDGAGDVRLPPADATGLPGPDAAFDAALSVQVLGYVAALDTALAELHRALRPGGRLVIWDIDWSTVSWHATDPAPVHRGLPAWDAEQRHLGERGEFFFACIQCCFTATRPTCPTRCVHGARRPGPIFGFHAWPPALG